MASAQKQKRTPTIPQLHQLLPVIYQGTQRTGQTNDHINWKHTLEVGKRTTRHLFQVEVDALNYALGALLSQLIKRK
jgi:hypothetical protein